MSLDVTIVSSSIRMIKGVIFDMDGVIIDSEPVYNKMVQEFLDREGIEADRKEIHSLVGMSSGHYAQKLKEWWQRSYHSAEDPGDLYKKFCVETEEEQLSYNEIIIPFVEEVMAALTEHNIKIAIASSSSMQDIDKMLTETGLGRFISVKLSGENLKESKPNPEIYLLAVKRLGLHRQECIAVEDSTYGIQAAVDAGIKVIARREERFGFDQKKADYIVDDLTEVLKIIGL